MSFIIDDRQSKYVAMLRASNLLRMHGHTRAANELRFQISHDSRFVKTTLHSEEHLDHVAKVWRYLHTVNGYRNLEGFGPSVQTLVLDALRYDQPQ